MQDTKPKEPAAKVLPKNEKLKVPKYWTLCCQLVTIDILRLCILEILGCFVGTLYYLQYSVLLPEGRLSDLTTEEDYMDYICTFWSHWCYHYYSIRFHRSDRLF